MNTPSIMYAYLLIGQWGEAVQYCVWQLSPVPDAANLDFI